MLIYATVMFFLATIASIVVLRWLFPDRSRQRLQQLAQTGEERKTDWMSTAVSLARPLAKLSNPAGKWEDSPTRVKFITAGIRSTNAPVIFYAAKTILPFLMAAIGYLALQMANVTLVGNNLLLVLLILATIGVYLPNIVLSRAISARQREIFENFPDAVDLLLVCVEAGLGFDAAMGRIVDELKLGRSALREEIHLTMLETRAGIPREQALRNLGLRTGVEEINGFASIVTQAGKFGTTMGQSLRVYSEELRHKRQIRAEEQAAKLPTKMLFPLVLCIFPGISMVILGPAVVRIIRVLGPMIGGQH